MGLIINCVIPGLEKYITYSDINNLIYSHQFIHIYSVSRLLEYTPSARITPLQACAHTFFDELREPGTKLPNGREMPPLFNFTEAELKIQPTLNSQLIPAHMASGIS